MMVLFTIYLLGLSVSVSGDAALIGAPGNDDNGESSGSAYVFTRTNGVWIQQQKLVASDATSNESFGIDVSLSGNMALIGAYASISSGSSYVFSFQNGTWTEQEKLTPNDGSSSDDFGKSVALSGNTALVGDFRNDDNGTDSGSAYFFDISDLVP